MRVPVKDVYGKRSSTRDCCSTLSRIDYTANTRDDASITMLMIIMTSFGLSIGIKAYVLLLYNSRNLTCYSYAQKNQRLKFGYSTVIILLTDTEYI